jgi:uncharacterized protein GlcG (DUF336 family)
MSLARTLAFLDLTIAAFGQVPLVPPPKVPCGISISKDTAKKEAAAAIAEVRANKSKMALASGYLGFFERMPYTQLGSVKVSMDKATSATLFRRSSRNEMTSDIVQAQP